MTRTDVLFIAGLLAVGLAAGLVLARVPGSIPLPSPALLVPLAIGLAADLLLAPAIRAGRLPPLSMNARAIGVIGGALVATVIEAAAAG